LQVVSAFAALGLVAAAEALTSIRSDPFFLSRHAPSTDFFRFLLFSVTAPRATAAPPIVTAHPQSEKFQLAADRTDFESERTPTTML